MTEYSVIGVPFSHERETVVLYLQSEYNPNYARNLAEALVWARESANDVQPSRLLLFLLSENEARISPALPETNHTIHIVDFDKREVQLYGGLKPFDLLVSFGFSNYIGRYK